MKHTTRETPEDKANEKIILEVVSKHLQCEYEQIMTCGKYNIDAWMYRGRDVLAWVECKWLAKEGFYGLNVPKYIEGCELATHTDVPFYYAARVPGKIGILLVHSGVWAEAKTKLQRCGGKRSPPNWDDIEPMMMFDPKEMKWIATK